MLSATAAPTPVSPPPSCLPEALVVLDTSFFAVIVTSPPPMRVTEVPSAMAASTRLVTTLMASAPATPVSPPLAPEIASTTKVSAPFMCARALSDPAVTPPEPPT